MATCKDCIHYEVCKTEKGSTVFYREGLLESTYNQVDKLCGALFKDKSRFVELPCKVGDLIYIIKKARGLSVRGAKVNSITITESGEIQVSCYRSSFIGLWNNDAFATKEEAEKAVKERSYNA